MIKKLLALMILAVGMSVHACWFTELNFAKAYIAQINTVEVFYSAYEATATGDFSYLSGTYQVNGKWNGAYTYCGGNPVIPGFTPPYGTFTNPQASGRHLKFTDVPVPRWDIDETVFPYAGGTALYYKSQYVFGDVKTPPLTGWTPLAGHGTGTVTLVKVPTPWNSGDPISCPPAGIQDLPCQVWIKLQPRSEEGAPAITEALLQYKKLPSGAWTTFKTLRQLNWTMDFSKPVQLFGPNIFDPPGAQSGNEYLVRLYFTDGIYENADLGTNAPEGGDTTWRNQWVTKITISGKRRPQ